MITVLKANIACLNQAPCSPHTINMVLHTNNHFYSQLKTASQTKHSKIWVHNHWRVYITTDEEDKKGHLVIVNVKRQCTPLHSSILILKEPRAETFLNKVIQSVHFQKHVQGRLTSKYNGFGVENKLSIQKWAPSFVLFFYKWQFIL